MQSFVCTKCGSVDVYIKENGAQTGLYCGDCGKWIKWLGKEEKRLAERWIENNKNISTEENISLSENEVQLIKKKIENIKVEIQEIEKILDYQ